MYTGPVIKLQVKSVKVVVELFLIDLSSTWYMMLIDKKEEADLRMLLMQLV